MNWLNGHSLGRKNVIIRDLATSLKSKTASKVFLSNKTDRINPCLTLHRPEPVFNKMKQIFVDTLKLRCLAEKYNKTKQDNMKLENQVLSSGLGTSLQL